MAPAEMLVNGTADLRMWNGQRHELAPAAPLAVTAEWWSIGSTLQGARRPVLLSWGGCVGAEPAVGDAAQDRDGRG